MEGERAQAEKGKKKEEGRSEIKLNSAAAGLM